METEQIDRGKSVALHLLHQFRQLGAEAGGLGFVTMHDGVFKQRIQPLDFLNRFVSLWHRHNVSANLCVNQRGFFAAAQLIT